MSPGDLVWIGPGVSLYPIPDIKLAADADIPCTDDWCLALLIAVFDFWCMVLVDDALKYIGKNSLMSSDLTPSSVALR